MHLIKSFVQLAPEDSDTYHESDLSIEVDYDPSEHVVREVISVQSYSYKYKKFTDLSHIFCVQLSDQLEQILAKVDWFELYMETKNQKVA